MWDYGSYIWTGAVCAVVMGLWALAESKARHYTVLKQRNSVTVEDFKRAMEAADKQHAAAE